MSSLRSIDGRPALRFWSVTLTAATVLLVGLLWAGFLENRLTLGADDRLRVQPWFTATVKARLPAFQERLDTSFAGGELRLEQAAEAAVDAAFAPVYANIDAYLDAHYSVLGGYTELAAALGSEIAAEMAAKLFDRGFDARIAAMTASLETENQQILEETLSEVRQAAADTLRFSAKDIQLAAGTAPLGFHQIKARFTPELALTRVLGAGGGAVVGRYLARGLATRSMTLLGRQAARAGASRVAGGAAGAQLGAKAGLLCGPYAWVCAPLALLGGAVAGAYLTESAIVTMDEVINRSAYRAELIRALDAQKTAFKTRLTEGPISAARAVNGCVKQAFDDVAGGGLPVGELASGAFRGACQG